MSNYKQKIIVTQPEFEKGYRIFKDNEHYEFITSAGDETSLAKTIVHHQARYAIVGSLPYSNTLYKSFSRWGLIARFGVGHDNIDIKMATSEGIYCTNTPGILNDSVAELTVALIMEISRKIGIMNPMLKQGNWHLEPGFELKGKKIAILGCGQIGSRVAFILRNGFRMQVVGYDKMPDFVNNNSVSNSFDKVFPNLEEALSNTDFVSIHIPAYKNNHHFIDSRVLGLVPEKAWLINTSRGSILDEIALYNALKHGSIAGAALDVFKNEPYKPLSSNTDLRTLPNVIMTPHAGSSTQEANDRMAKACLKNIDLSICGEYHKMDIINPKILTKHLEAGGDVLA